VAKRYYSTECRIDCAALPETVVCGVYFRRMALERFARMSRLKVLLGILFAVAAGLLPRTRCSVTDGATRCVNVQVLQYAPLLESGSQQLRSARSYIDTASRTVSRMLDVGFAYVAACLVLGLFGGAAAGSGRSRMFELLLLSAALSITAFLTAQQWQIRGAPVLYRHGWFVLDAPTLLRDICDSALFAALAVAQIVPRPGAWSPLIRFRHVLAWSLLVNQAAGLLFRYSGASFAPSDTMALALGIAWVASPLQTALILLTTYCRPAARNGSSDN
jgi:hypothetical protein